MPKEGSDATLRVDGGITPGIEKGLSEVIRSATLQLESALCYGSLPNKNYIINRRPNPDVGPVNNKWVYAEEEKACSFRCQSGYVPHFGNDGNVDSCIIDDGTQANDYCPIDGANNQNCIGVKLPWITSRSLVAIMWFPTPQPKLAGEAVYLMSLACATT